MLKDKENAVLVGIITQNQRDREVQEYLDELSFLTETAGAEEVKRFVQKLEHPHPKTFVGTGKLNEIAGYIKENKINLLIFDDELSPSQLRNIENIVSCKVLDRTNLILDIFAQRAKTAHSKIQVELAQYQYLLPRLTRMWTHLERQQGGIGMRGPGETEIETDRRVIRDKNFYLKEQLKQIDKQMATQRKTRNELPRVALIGYTNVGKSTIMNMLSKSDVFAENKLFATLDTTVRKVVIETTPFLLSDTVGFIRKLPHNLVESFKSTLDEARESDILLHVVDISHSNFEDQIHVVNQTLLDINVKEKPTLLVFNKIDAYSFVKKDEDDLSPATDENMSLEQLKNSWMAKNNNPCIFISAKNKSNIDIFRSQLLEMITKVNLRK